MPKLSHNLRGIIGIIKKMGLFGFLLFFILPLSGCQLKKILINWDKKIGETFNEFQENGENSIIELMEEKSTEKKSTSSEEQINGLTKEKKKKIDKWLEKKGLNRYGDDKNAMYLGGTPLFDEKTGEAKDRYDYLLNKFPNLLEIIEK